MAFAQRVTQLPQLGVGISTEFAAADSGGLCPQQLRADYPQFAQFLELGIEVAKGLDTDALQWIADEAPTTYHFLDVNLDEAEDFDPQWLAQVKAWAEKTAAAWLCGDAGLWHFGPREPGHMLLLPPLLTDASARELAPGIVTLREATQLEVLPENPPGTAYVGDLHILDYFARVCDYADTGMLLDVAHLAMYQQVTGREPLDGLDGFDWSRVVEVHVAGGKVRTTEGFAWIEDDHGPHVLPATWQIFDEVMMRAENLKAIVVEGERNAITKILPVFERAHDAWVSR